MQEPGLKIGSGGDELSKKEAPIHECIEGLLQKTDSKVHVISLCGLIGTDLHGVADRIKTLLQNVFNCEVEIIKLSSFIRTYVLAVKDLPTNISHYESYKKFIEGGIELREKYGSSALVKLAIQKIFEEVTKTSTIADKSLNDKCRCYIIDSIKNGDELQLLKLVYKSRYYSIGAFTTIENRRSYLQIYKGMNEMEINALIDASLSDEKKHEQEVMDTLIQSDFFLRLGITANKFLDQKLQRFLHLVFKSAVITPTLEETAMYQAASVANNSTYLSKQVSASSANQRNETLSSKENNTSEAGIDLRQNNNTNYLEVRAGTNEKNKAVFTLYDGVAPCRYNELFDLPTKRSLF